MVESSPKASRSYLTGQTKSGSEAPDEEEDNRTGVNGAPPLSQAWCWCSQSSTLGKVFAHRTQLGAARRSVMGPTSDGLRMPMRFQKGAGLCDWRACHGWGP